MSAPPVPSTFQEKRAANLARNQTMLSSLEQLPAVVNSAPPPPPPNVRKRTPTVKKTVAVASAAPVVERKSARISALPRRSLREEDLAPALPAEDTKGAAVNSRKRKGGGDNENGGSGKREKGARLGYRKRAEYGLSTVTVTEADLAAIRDNYAVMRLATFAVAGVHPAEYSNDFKKKVRLSNAEFARLNGRRKARGEEEVRRRLPRDEDWVAANAVADEKYVRYLAKRAAGLVGEGEYEDVDEDEDEGDGKDEE